MTVTDNRYQRLRTVLERRQPDLTVLLDNVHKPHNFSAILRTCDAVGVRRAHAVWPSPRLRPAHATSGGAAKWVDIETHPTLDEAAAGLEQDGFTIAAAHLSADAVDFRELDYTRPTAVLLGAERDGLSEAGLRVAHRHIIVPMVGNVRSLNVSVAAAVILFEAQRQREHAGLYARPRLPGAEIEATLFEWTHPRVADWCRRRGRAYPPVDERGAIVGPLRG